MYTLTSLYTVPTPTREREQLANMFAVFGKTGIPATGHRLGAYRAQGTKRNDKLKPILTVYVRRKYAKSAVDDAAAIDDNDEGDGRLTVAAGCRDWRTRMAPMPHGDVQDATSTTRIIAYFTIITTYYYCVCVCVRFIYIYV